MSYIRSHLEEHADGEDGEQIEKDLIFPNSVRDPEAEERTIYVGNVKATAKKKKLQKFFSTYGEVETIRYRGAAPEKMDMSKREAITTGKLHKHRPTIIAYIRFKDKESKERALSASGEVFHELHLSVDHAVMKSKREPNSIFVGNLPWEVEDEQLWTHFGSCGPIRNVRIVRSSETGASKGFGYISFKTREAVDSSLKLTDTTINDRPIRVKRTSKKEKIKRALKKKPKSGVASLLKIKAPSKMNLDFLKNDKPHANKIKAKKQLERRHLKPTKKAVNTFSGTEHSGKASNTMGLEKKTKLNRNNRRKRRVAKILAAKNS